MAIYSLIGQPLQCPQHILLVVLWLQCQQPISSSGLIVMDYTRTLLPVDQLYRTWLLAKITFWQVCWSVRLSVCLFVCLFVTLSHHMSRTNRQIITKLGPHMELGTAKRPIDFGVDDVTDDVIRSKNRSNFEIVISQAVFKLQHRNKNWNAALIMGHLSVMVDFRYHFR